MSPGWLDILERDGCVLLPGLIGPADVDRLRRGVEEALSRAPHGPMRTADGAVYGARNVLTLYPEATHVEALGGLAAALRAALGEGCGLVRGLYFDKPPGGTWALPWHKDLTVAVRDNAGPFVRFSKPTRKEGVPHLEAPEEVLAGMLTARLHLDPAGAENGALQVLAGSHRTGKKLVLEGTPRLVEAAVGDVLLMRPLVAHASGRSVPGSDRHRRILHLEFAPAGPLPEGQAWNTWHTVGA